MISISAVSLRSFTSFDDTLKNLRSGLDKGPIIMNQVFNENKMNYALEIVPSEIVEGKKISYWKIVKVNREHDD